LTRSKRVQLEGAILSKDELTARIDKDLFIEPLLSRDRQLGDASVDIRLGTHFIVTRMGGLSHFKPSELDEAEIRRLQERVSKSPGDIFVLHLRRLVLGCTLEYIALPRDLSALVLTRSRYGRIGLIVATAAFVHPGWKGCLTLELSNVADVPLELQCGATIAQLVVFHSKMVPLVTRDFPLDSLPFPTRPEFSRLGSENEKQEEWKKLKGISDLAKAL